MTDTGTSCTYVPKALFSDFKSKLLKDQNYWSSSNDYYTYADCGALDKFPVIELGLGNLWVEMRPEDYFVNWYGTCFLCIFEN